MSQMNSEGKENNIPSIQLVNKSRIMGIKNTDNVFKQRHPLANLPLV